MTTSVHNAAAYIVKVWKETRPLCPLYSFQLHKLLYYSQAWSLVWDKEPLFNASILAWEHGPAIQEIYNQHCSQNFTSEINDWPLSNPEPLNTNQKETIKSILAYYGHYTPQQLKDLVTMEQPWKKAREAIADTTRGHGIISHQSMQDYYSSIKED